MSVVTQALTSSLTIVGILGILLLLVSFVITDNFYLSIFTQFLAIISMSVLFLVTFFSIKKDASISVSMLLLFMGSGGRLITLIKELFLDQIMDKPVLYNVTSVLIALGIISFINVKCSKNESNK